MYTLALRTDKPEAELYLYSATGQLQTEHQWLANRELANQLPGVIEQFLLSAKAPLDQVGGIIVFQGPGSFTGLRIGITVANTLAYSQSIPVVACPGDDWQQDGLQKLVHAQPGMFALPAYGAPPHITQPKK